MNRPAIAVVSEIPTPYRQPVFEQVSMSREFDFHFFYLNTTQKDRAWEVRPLAREDFTDLKSRQWCLAGHHTFYFTTNLFKKINADEFDLFVLLGYAQPALIELLFKCWRSGKPYIVGTESHAKKKRSWWKKSLKGPFLKRVYGRSAANFVTSSLAKEYVLSYGAPEKSIFLFPNMFDSVEFIKEVAKQRFMRRELKKQYSLSGEPVILFVGSLVRRKGVDLLLSAFTRLSRRFPDATIVLAGEGELKGDLLSKIHNDGLERKAVLTGFIQPEKLPELYALADIFVLPSLDEPFGAVICEAAAAGLPIVTSDCVGAAADFVENDRSGYVLPAGNEDALEGALEKLLTFPELRARLGERSKEIMTGWTHKKLAETMLAAVRDSLGKGLEK